MRVLRSVAVERIGSSRCRTGCNCCSINSPIRSRPPTPRFVWKQSATDSGDRNPHQGARRRTIRKSASTPPKRWRISTQTAAVETLATVARDEPAFRVNALAALSAMDDVMAYDALRELLDVAKCRDPLRRVPRFVGNERTRSAGPRRPDGRPVHVPRARCCRAADDSRHRQLPAGSRVVRQGPAASSCRWCSTPGQNILVNGQSGGKIIVSRFYPGPGAGAADGFDERRRSGPRDRRSGRHLSGRRAGAATSQAGRRAQEPLPGRRACRSRAASTTATPPSTTPKKTVSTHRPRSRRTRRSTSPRRCRTCSRNSASEVEDCGVQSADCQTGTPQSRTPDSRHSTLPCSKRSNSPASRASPIARGSSFPRGVSIVVGPNGSGKSNVVDAVKWVLGSQSAKSLRGQEMTDVIFNGCATRGPLGTAEVTLTLDNSDGKLGDRRPRRPRHPPRLSQRRGRIPDQSPALPAARHPRTAWRAPASRPKPTASSSRARSTCSCSRRRAIGG